MSMEDTAMPMEDTTLLHCDDPNHPEALMAEEKCHEELGHLIVIVAAVLVLSIVFGVALRIIFVVIRLVRNFNEEGKQLGDEDKKDREDLIRSKFHFQKVSSNIILSCHSKNATPGENKKTKEEEEEEEEAEEVDEELGDSAPSAKEAPPKGDDKSSSPTTQTRLSTLMKNTFGLNTTALLLSSWRRPAGVAECCICLTEYKADEIICTPKTALCNHMFHEKCVKAWLMANHDNCPLCRINVLKESEELARED